MANLQHYKNLELVPGIKDSLLESNGNGSHSSEVQNICKFRWETVLDNDPSLPATSSLQVLNRKPGGSRLVERSTSWILFRVDLLVA